MRKALTEFRDAGRVGGGEPEVGDGDETADMENDALEQRVAALEGREQQPDEAYAFGPAAPLVAEWRELRTGGDQAVNRVARARIAVRRWELESQILGEYHLTLPPETHPLETREGRTMFAGGRMPSLRPAGSWLRPDGPIG